MQLQKGKRYKKVCQTTTIFVKKGEENKYIFLIWLPPEKRTGWSETGMGERLYTII